MSSFILLKNIKRLYVIIGIAKAFRSRIYVTDEKRKMLMCQEIPGIESLLTNDPHQASVHVVSLMSIKSSVIFTFHLLLIYILNLVNEYI